MGFALKKIISAFLMPLSLGLTLGIIGLWFLYRNSFFKAKIFLTSSFLFIALVSYLPVANITLAPLENSYPRLNSVPKDIKHILLLGGDMKNRAWEALRLYHAIPNAIIITSGYAGSGKIPEAIKTAKVLESIGINKQQIIIHPQPKDTQEEALKIKQLLGDKRFILVTSAYHMKRAINIFEKTGLHPIPAPTDFKIKQNNNMIKLPSANGLQKSEVSWHEYLGLIWWNLKSYKKLI